MLAAVVLLLHVIVASGHSHVHDTCAETLCIQDTTCIETPTGPQCVPNKPGECPLYECARPVEPPNCNDTCTVVSGCKRNDKCCWGCNGCYSCVMVRVSCASILCVQDTTCIETPTGPQCVPNKPGMCPLFGCPVPLVRKCRDTCRSDLDCKRGNKCCVGCNGCRSCMAPIYISPCDTIKCLAGLACVMQQVQCITTPCDPVPTCVDTAPNPGRCPVIKQDDVSTCEVTCQYDSQCRPFQKCCKKACGGTACTDPEPELICNMLQMCVINTTCRIVLDKKTGAVSPQCVEVPPGGDNDKVCFPGSPLLVVNNAGQVTVSFCGRGPHRVDCPDGYHCKIAPDDSYAVCCPEVCSLPKVVGMCEAAIPSFYFDHNSRLCKRFYYGGCGGNANRFPTRRACNRACGFIKCPQIPEMKCAITWNQCTTSGEYPKVCPPWQTCCKTPCGRRCYVP